MNLVFQAALFGLLGGLIRAFVGIIKQSRISKKKKFKPYYLTITLIVSALIGAIASAAFSTNSLINLIIGYAGIDLLDNLLKIIKKKN